MVSHVGGDMISLVLTLALPAAYVCYQWWTAPGDNDDEKTSHSPSESVIENEQQKWSSGQRRIKSREERSGARQVLCQEQGRVVEQQGGDGGVGPNNGSEQTDVLTQGVESGQGRRGKKKKKASAAEIQHLHDKIGRLLTTMNEYEDDDPALSGKSGSKHDDNECIICVTRPVSVHTLPCAHHVTCHSCLLRTMQTALTDRRLPLTCVICRQKITGIQRIEGQRQQQAVDDKRDISGSNHNANANHKINPNSKLNNNRNPNSNHRINEETRNSTQNEREIARRGKTARSGVVKWNQWASGERWSDDNDRRSGDSDRWNDNNDRWSDNNDRWTIDNDRWSADSDRWNWWPQSFTTVDISPWWLI